MLERILIYWFLFSSLIAADTFRFSSGTSVWINADQNTVQTASDILRRYLSPLTAIRIATDNTALSSADIMITTTQHPPPEISKNILRHASTLKHDGYILQIDSNRITLIGTNSRSILYGIYFLLEKMGFLFLSPSYIHTPSPLPEKLATATYIRQPRFAYREIFVAESDNWHYALQNGLNGRLGHRTEQTFQNDPPLKGRNIYNRFTPYALVPQEEYHCNGQLIFSSPEVRRIAAQKTGQLLADIPFDSEDYIYLQHEDVNSFCHTDGNRDKAAGAFIDYTRYIAAHLAPHYQNAHFLLEAYQWTRTPPANMQKLPANLSVMFSTIEADFAKPLQSPDNHTILSDLNRWQTYSDDIIVWHYITNFGGYMQPFPTLYPIAHDIRTLAKMPHVKGIFLQGAYETTGSALANLRIWLYAKLLWDPDQNTEQLVTAFCDHYYGKAGRYVKQYIDTLHRVVAEKDQKLLLKTPPNAAYLDSKTLDMLESILDQGWQHIRNNHVAKAHMLEVYSSIDYIRLLTEDNKTKRDKSRQRFLSYIRTHPTITHYAEGAKITSLMQIIQMDRQRAPVPKYAKNKTEGTQWLDFQAYTLKLCCADIVQDPAASDRIAARMRGSQSDWGFQLDLNTNLPKGRWDLYARVKVTLTHTPSLIEQAKPALFFGIHPDVVRGTLLLAQLTPAEYKTFKIGSIDTEKTNARYLWISPPGNDLIRHLCVDRIFAVRQP